MFPKDLSIRHIPRIGRPLGQRPAEPLIAFKVMLFRLEGVFTLERNSLPDALDVLGELLRTGEDKNCILIVLAGPETWIRYP